MDNRTVDRRTSTDRRTPQPAPPRPLTDRDVDWTAKVARLR